MELSMRNIGENFLVESLLAYAIRIVPLNENTENILIPDEINHHNIVKITKRIKLSNYFIFNFTLIELLLYNAVVPF